MSTKLTRDEAAHAVKGVKLLAVVKQAAGGRANANGQVTCPTCGSKVSWFTVGNGHVRTGCSHCGVGMME